MNKTKKGGISIVFLILITIISLKILMAIEGTSDEYNIRLSLGSLASNTSSSDYGQIEMLSDSYSANLTSETFGHLSIYRNNLPPQIPALYLPLNESFSQTASINFSWYNSTDPNKQMEYDVITYTLEVYDNPELTSFYYSNSTIEEISPFTSHSISVPEELALYWRVLATDNGELNSSWSEVRETGVDFRAPTEFLLVSPDNNTATTDNTPALSWTATNESNLDNYTIEFSTSSEYITPNYTQKERTTAFSNWSIQLPADTYYWRVVAYDKSARSNISDQRVITITAISETVEETIVSGTSTSTASGGVKKQPFNLDLISPPSVTVYSNDSVIVPLIITNPANEITLNQIDLEVTSDSEDVATYLGATHIPQLRPKEQRTVPLTIVTHTTPTTYGITITATVRKPYFTDSAKIYANLIEKDSESKSSSSKQLIFAQDLFNGNPRCLELKEYIDQAEIEFNNGRYDKAMNLANNAIQSCKDLIAFKTEPEEKNIQTYLKKAKLNKTILILIGESFAFLLVIGIVYKIFKKKK